jgi:hypothetical protein
MPKTKSPDPGPGFTDLRPALSRKLLTALALYDSGVAMQRARLRREDPAASEDVISDRLSAWLISRPGAEFGDAEGIGRTFADTR